MKTALVLAFIVSFGFAKEPPKEDPAKKVIEKLQGEWIVDHAEKEGKKLSEEERRKLSEFFLTKAVITDETVQLWLSHKGEDAQGADALPLEVDPGKKPGRIRIKDFYGIYLLDGDTLKVCFKDQPGSDKQDEVPTAFDTNMGADWYLFVFKREKK